MSTIVLIYGLRFDILANARNGYGNEAQSDCEGSYIDITEQIWLKYNATQGQLIDHLNDPANTENYFPPDNDSFGKDITTTDRWLLSLALSFLLSIFITEPLSLGVKAILRILCFNPTNIDEAYFWVL